MSAKRNLKISLTKDSVLGKNSVECTVESEGEKSVGFMNLIDSHSQNERKCPYKEHKELRRVISKSVAAVKEAN